MPGKPLDFSEWESSTQRPLYTGQLEPVRSWIRGKVLDVASNYGRFSALSSSSISVDIETKFLKRGIETGRISRAVVGSALSLPFRDASFDTVLAMGIIDHIPHPSAQRFLNEITRVAADESRVIVQVTSPLALFVIRNLRSYDEWTHPYSPFRLIRDFRRRRWRLVGSMSSGLIGLIDIVPKTVRSLVPWAVHTTLVFTRQLSR